jgi:MFS family permease
MKTRRSLWRDADFMRLWTAESVSRLGSQVSLLALPLAAITVLHASTFEVGLLSTAEFAPFVLVGLPAGVWVDRRRRRPILIAADLARAGLLLSIPLAALAGLLRIEQLYLVALLAGALTVFFDVAALAFLPALVGREQLLDGNSKLMASRSVAQIAGPGLAGLLVGLVSAPVAIAVDACSFLLSALSVGVIGAPEPPPARPAERPSVRTEIGEGLRVVLGDPLLRALAAGSATTALFGYLYLAVYVLYMTRELGLPPALVGLVLGVGGVGALLGTLLAGSLTRRFGLGATIIWAQALVGLGSLLVPLAGLAPALALPLLLVSELVSWFMLPIRDINQTSLRQAITPDRLQGRVNATVRFLVWGCIPIGGLLGGALGEAIGLGPTLVLGSLGMLASIVWALVSPVAGLRRQPSAPAGSP